MAAILERLSVRTIMAAVALTVLGCAPPNEDALVVEDRGTALGEEIESESDWVHIHPLFAEDYACQEHWDGQLKYQGDALGTDCFVTELVEAAPETAFSRAFQGDGLRNEDWFGWRKEVLAPFDGTIKKIAINEVTNDPGKLGSPPASIIIFERADGVHVLFAHVREISVDVGDRVKAGQRIARVGNNGFGRNPHIHIGAWRGEQPLQLRHDLVAMGELRSGPGDTP